MASGLDLEAKSLVESCEPTILARAVHYLYTKETKSSFAIEGEVPSAKRTERFVAALTRAAKFDTSDPQAFIRLENDIVDLRYAATGWRIVQSFIGETMSDFREHVHFVCPKPEDLADLMNGWMGMMENLRHSKVDPVCAAAAASFGFVFIHPFEDGNGRIHRFLIHQALASSGFTPHQMLFPVSAVMMRNRSRYDEILWKASLNRFRPTSTTRCIRTDRWSSIIRLRTCIDSGTQPDSRSTYMSAWLKPFALI
jgi:Fic family protein